MHRTPIPRYFKTDGGDVLNMPSIVGKANGNIRGVPFLPKGWRMSTVTVGRVDRPKVDERRSFQR